jgi:hypothetical protein
MDEQNHHVPSNASKEDRRVSHGSLETNISKDFFSFTT